MSFLKCSDYFLSSAAARSGNKQTILSRIFPGPILRGAAVVVRAGPAAVRHAGLQFFSSFIQIWVHQSFSIYRLCRLVLREFLSSNSFFSIDSHIQGHLRQFSPLVRVFSFDLLLREFMNSSFLSWTSRHKTFLTVYLYPENPLFGLAQSVRN